VPFVVSITRLRLRSLRFLPYFLVLNEGAVRQLRKAAGFRRGKLLVDRRLTFWTMSGWEDEASLRAYRDADAHRAVMPKLAGWCDEASVARWQDGTGELPSWPEAHARMIAQGRASKVRHPSPDQTHLRFPAPRWTGLARAIERQPVAR
jgi:quinol monooxygenase YgiN